MLKAGKSKASFGASSEMSLMMCMSERENARETYVWGLVSGEVRETSWKQGGLGKVSEM